MEKISFVEATQLLDRYKIKMTPAGFFTDRKLAWSFAEQHKPVAIKVDAPEIWHRTEVGGVILNIANRPDFDLAWNSVSRDGTAGVIVQPMRSGIELSLGAKRDSQFGPLVMFGLGGILVELIEDVSFAIAPIDESEARKMIQSIRAYKLLTGFRGRPKVDQSKLVWMLVRLSYLMSENPEIEEIDLNPVMAQEDLVEAIDVKVWIHKYES